MHCACLCARACVRVHVLVCVCVCACAKHIFLSYFFTKHIYSTLVFSISIYCIIFLLSLKDKPVQVFLKPSYMDIVLYVASGISCYFLMCTLLVYFLMR